MAIDCEQMEQLKRMEHRSRRLKAAVDEWMNLIDQTRETMPEDSRSDFVTTLRIPPNGSKRSH